MCLILDPPHELMHSSTLSTYYLVSCPPGAVSLTLYCLLFLRPRPASFGLLRAFQPNKNLSCNPRVVAGPDCRSQGLDENVKRGLNPDSLWTARCLVKSHQTLDHIFRICFLLAVRVYLLLQIDGQGVFLPISFLIRVCMKPCPRGRYIALRRTKREREKGGKRKGRKKERQKGRQTDRSLSFCFVQVCIGLRRYHAPVTIRSYQSVSQPNIYYCYS
jgi:hypothetical protein